MRFPLSLSVVAEAVESERPDPLDLLGGMVLRVFKARKVTPDLREILARKATRDLVESKVLRDRLEEQHPFRSI